MGCGHGDDLHSAEQLAWHTDDEGSRCHCIEEEHAALEQHDPAPGVFPCDVWGCECEEYTPYSDADEYEPDLEAGT
jgi:hypothetical protein